MDMNVGVAIVHDSNMMLIPLSINASEFDIALYLLYACMKKSVHICYIDPRKIK